MKNDDIPNLREIALQVAEHLPGYHLAPLTPDDNQWSARDSAYLVNGDSLGLYVPGESKALHMGQSWPRGRLAIGCCWPHGKDGAYSPRESKSITVAAKRPPKEIAKDIERRLLEWYAAEWAAACERREEHRREEQARMDVSARFAGIMGPTVHRRDDGYFLSAGDVNVEIHHSDKASIKLSYASIALVEKVLRALEAQGVFVPHCVTRDDDGEYCLEVATHCLDKWWGKEWLCDRHYSEATKEIDELF